MPVQKLAVPVLALACLGLGIFAYSEHTARVAAETRLSALQADATDRASSPEAPVSLPTPEPATGPVPLPADASSEPVAATYAEARPAPAAPGSPARNYAAMMETPEMQQLIALRARGQLDSRYADLFAKLRLSPAQLQRLQQLLADKQNTTRDVMAAMRSQGLSTRRDNAEQTRSLIQDANAEIDAQIRAELGEAVFAQYQEYERTQPQRALVNRVSQRLSYSGEPLSEQQAAGLVSLFAEIAPAPVQTPRGPLPGPGFAGTASLTDEALARAATMLTPTQLAALRQLHQEQEAQNQLMRRARQGMNASGAPR